MRLDSIELRDFRGISHLAIPIDEKLTVIVGDNGVGKTSILNAVSLALSGLRSLWPDESGNARVVLNSVSPSDIALGKQDFMVKTSVSFNASADGRQTHTLQLGANNVKNRLAASTLAQVGQKIGEGVVGNEPLLVYYLQNRVFEAETSHPHRDTVSAEEVRRQSLSSDLRAIQDLSSWWDRLDAQEARRHRDEEHGFRDPQLEAIRKLVKEMEEFEGVGYETKERRPGLYLKKTKGPKLHVEQLSSGERAYLILLADLARRLQVVEPDAELADIPGIVLIDEIELNLHPNWQRLIVPTLVRVFKGCQFIVTTHSPQVLGEIRSGRIIVLRKKDREIQWREGKATFGRDSNDILLNLLNSPERDREVKARLENLERLLGTRKLKEARRAIEELRLELGWRPVELDIAEQRLRRREGRSED